MIGILWLFLQSAASHLLYLALRLETGSFPKPLSAKEEQAAFAAMRAGDVAARETLICHNLRLVAHIVKKYYTVSGGQDDFISIGTIGLIKAVDTYDCTRTTRFASYASRCIENELRMQLRPCPPAPRVEPTAPAVTAQTFAFCNSRSSADNCFCKSQKYDFSKLLALSPAFPL